MKKTLFTLLTAINLAFLYCPAIFALIKDEAAAAVGAQGKDAVSGNLFLWLLCAIAFLKVVTKLDGILHSLGIGVSRSPGSMLSEVLLAFRGFEIGQAFMGLGVAKAAAATTNTKTTPGNIIASGLSGMVSRHVQQSAASSISWANRRQHYRRQHRRSAEELFYRYQRHGRYTDSCHQRKYLYCESAATLSAATL